MADIEQGKPLAYSIKEASRLSSLGRSNINNLIAAHRLETIKVGRRTLIVGSSLRKLLGEEE